MLSLKKRKIIIFLIIIFVIWLSFDLFKRSAEGKEKINQINDNGLSRFMIKSVRLTGWFSIIWKDNFSAQKPYSEIIYMLTDDAGKWTRFTIDENLLRQFGDFSYLNMKRVIITGETIFSPIDMINLREPAIKVRTIQLEHPDEAKNPEQQIPEPPIHGNKKWLTLLCLFADSPAEPPKPVSFFEGMMGSTYPGMDHFWRELSYDDVNLSGSIVKGWYKMAKNRSEYIPAGDSEYKEFNDCVSAAFPPNYFPDYDGINLVFENNPIGCCSGGTGLLNRNGQKKWYMTTWLDSPIPIDQRIWAHEMGHGFGLPHSSCPYQYVYDSNWDVMSRGGSIQYDGYAYIGVHTIAFYKYLMGWIPSSRMYVAENGSDKTITIEQLALPVSQDNYLFAKIPIENSDKKFYTVEARKLVGYDKGVPGDAIIMHKVDATVTHRGSKPATVVDADNNGNCNDYGAQWTPGKMFIDSINNVAVIVQTRNESSYVVTITRRPGISVICDPSLLPFLLRASKCKIASLLNFSGEVTLSCSGLPDGASCIFNPVKVAPPANATAESILKVKLDRKIPVGIHNFQVIGTSGTLIRKFDMQLEILN